MDQGASGVSVVPVSVGLRERNPIRAGTVLGHEELAHHPRVLVLQQMAVHHVGHRRVRVVLEPHDESHVLAGIQRHGVLPPAQPHRRLLSIDVEDAELHVVDVEVVGESMEQISRDRDLGDVRALVLTTFDTEEDVLAAVRAGASGYLLKDVDGPGLRQAIRDVASGDSIAAPSLTKILFRQASRSAHRPEMVAGLSERETEVLAQVGRGFTNAEIAEALFLSPETVRTYVSRMRTKLGARDERSWWSSPTNRDW